MPLEAPVTIASGRTELVMLSPLTVGGLEVRAIEKAPVAAVLLYAGAGIELYGNAMRLRMISSLCRPAAFAAVWLVFGGTPLRPVAFAQKAPAASESPSALVAEMRRSFTLHGKINRRRFSATSVTVISPIPAPSGSPWTPRPRSAAIFISILFAKTASGGYKKSSG
jgi:hypothetical protein